MASGVVPEIETERLLLRGPAAADVDVWATCVADPEFNRFQPKRDLTDQTPRDRAERKLTTYQRGWERQPVPYMGWVITTKANGRLIGLCEVSSDDEGTEGEIGYFLCPARWRQGFTTEAARAVVHYAFEHTTWDHLMGTVAPANVASVRILEHLGFVREKEMPSQDYSAMLADVLGDPTLASLEWPVPTFAIYTLRRDQFVPGDAFYRIHDAPPA
jgi:RimJ/RimL family protein N-acetyltransferase